MNSASSVAASLCEAPRFVCTPRSRAAHRATATACLLGALALLPAAFAVEPFEEIVEHEYSVDAVATLSVQNIDGSIRVYGADKPEIRIQAIKKAYDRERLEAIRVEVKATQNSVAVTTTFPPRKNALSDRSGTVDYIIVVPQTARVTDLSLTMASCSSKVCVRAAGPRRVL